MGDFYRTSGNGRARIGARRDDSEWSMEQDVAEIEKDFLEDMTSATAAEAEIPEPEQPDPEKGETVEPEKAEPEATPAPVAKKDDLVPYAAMKAEREKRQAHEKRIAELEKELQDREPAPNFYEAPEQFLSHALTQAQQQATHRLYAALEEQAREMYPDYDEVFAEVEAHCAQNPLVGQQVLQNPNPALAAYKLGKQMREMKAMQNPEEYRAKLKAELLAELRSEQQAKDDARRKQDDAIPPDLATARSSGDSAEAVGSVLDQLFTA